METKRKGRDIKAPRGSQPGLLCEADATELTEEGSIKNSREKIIFSLLLVMLSTKWYPDRNTACEVQHISYLGAQEIYHDKI